MSSLPGNYLSYPYGILKKYTIGGETYIGEYADAVNANLAAIDVSFNDTFVNILLASASNERAKEWNYINQMLTKLFSEDPKPLIYDDIKKMLNTLYTPGKGVSGAWVSQIVDTLQKLQFGLYDFNKSLKENMNIMKGFNEATLSKPFINAINQALGAKKEGRAFKYSDIKGDIKNMTGQKLIETIFDNIKTNVDEGVEKKGVKKDEFTEKQLKIINDLQTFYISKVQQFYTGKFQCIEDLDIMKTSLQELENKVINHNLTAKSKEKINADNKPIQQFIHELLIGAFGGQALEMTISLSGGGANTGKMVGTTGRSIDADNILLGTGKLEFFSPDLEALNNKDKKNISLTDLQKQIENIEELKDGLVIMTSAKDQSTNKTFNSFTATNTKVKLKDPGSLKARRGEIEDMFAAANCGGVDDLIFALANLAKDFVYEGKIEMAKKNLGTVCIAWMFDDAVEIIQGGSMFQNQSLGTNISTLHFYNINNYIYTLSDILLKTAQNLNKGIGKTGRNMKYVNIGISGTKIEPYTTLLSENNQLKGIERWNYVSNELMSNITISVHMNVKNLFNDLFKIKY